jgi:hypothetical protein
MMTRRCAAKAGADSAWSPHGDDLVSSGTHAASGNPCVCRQRQAGCSRAIGHSNRCRYRSFKRASVSGPCRNRGWSPRIDRRRHSLRSVVPCARKKNNNSNDLARGATKKSLIRSRILQNQEPVAPASRRRFFARTSQHKTADNPQAQPSRYQPDPYNCNSKVIRICREFFTPSCSSRKNKK